MNRHLLFCALLGLLTACQHEGDIQPAAASLAGEVVGTYHSNFYLDVSCVAIPADKMPYAQIKAESDSSVTLIYTKLYPAKTSRSFEHIKLLRQSAGIQLRMADSTLGTLKTDRIFTDNGMEKQGKLLRVTVQDPQNFLYFAGVRQ